MSDSTLIAAEVISAYVTNNSIPAAELPDLIRAVVSAFDHLGRPPVAEQAAPKMEPAVPVKKSVHKDYLISLEDGKRYQTLKRHLAGHGMTPDQYRAKWRLAADYPMTATAYSERRSEMSKALGLGRKPAEAAVVPEKPKRSLPKTKEQSATELPTEAPESVQEAA